MNLDKRLLTYLIKLKRAFFLSLILTLVTSAAIILQAKLLSRAINAVFLDKKDLATVLPFLLLFLTAAMVRAVAYWGSQSASHKIAGRVKTDLRRALFSHIFVLGPAYTRSQQTGELKNTIMSGIEALDAYFSQYLPQLFISIFVPALILLFVFPVDLLSGLVFLITAPLIPLFMILIGDLAQILTRKQWRQLSRMSAFFLDVLQGLTMLKILGQSKKFTLKIRDVTEEFRHTTMKVLRVAFLSALVLEMLATVSIAVIAVQIGLRLLYGKMAFEGALFILIIAPEFYQPLRQLGARFHAGLEGFTAAKRIFEILQEKPPSFHGTAKLENAFSTIVFENVDYFYPGQNQPALEQISFTLGRHEHIALVGPSGAGKTTVTFLLLGFIQPSNGVILLDEHGLAAIDIAWWRSHIAWAPQQPFLFHQSVRDNLRLVAPEATNDQIKRAAEKAHIHDLFSSLPHGYDTLIGERGARLSGGQAQRLALARVFLKNAPLVVLDEPTAHLDAETEALLQHAIADLSNDRTVLTIAHRLYTVEKADKIIVLDQGKIIDSGKHAELLTRCQLYQNLLRSREISA